MSVTKFVAYGDSITEGFVQVCPGAAPRLATRWTLPSGPPGLAFEPRPAPFAPTAYPLKLQGSKSNAGSITFDQWNEPVTLQAPANPVDFSKLTGG